MTEKEAKPDFYASWNDEARACMDYLSAWIIDDELEAACTYEYARESTILRDAAEERDRLRHQKRYSTGGLYREVARLINHKYRSGPWFNQHPWRFIWHCPSFPGTPWNQLGKQQRAAILHAFSTRHVQPLPMMEVTELDVTEPDAPGILDRFKEMATKAVLDQDKRVKKVFPVIHEGQRTHALFTLDFSDTKHGMIAQFAKWLELPENQKRLALHRSALPTGTSKDRLKDLAVWRLYRVLGYDAMLVFTRLNRRLFDKATKVGGVRYKKGDPMPFHAARPGKHDKSPLNEADLCSEEAFCRRAKARAKTHLTEIVPWEFGRYRKQSAHEEIKAIAERFLEFQKR